MTPQSILDHIDSGALWPADPGTEHAASLAQAYQSALQLRRLRAARGEVPRGYKIGFTNRQIWQRYEVFAPIWGTVWDSTLSHCEDQATLSLAACCQPRIEPEVVFGMKATPAAAASLEDIYAALDWLAPGFEVVQSHLPNWKFKAADTVADGGLHARLLVGRRLPIHQAAASAQELDALLAGARVTLYRQDQAIEQGAGANVLDSPLRALQHFLAELRACPGAADLLPGDVVTTGTWTDAWPVLAGENWSARFSDPLPGLRVQFR